MPRIEKSGEIREVVDRISCGFRPEKIILFGSNVRGETTADSDVDLLIIMNVKGSRRKKATEMDLALLGINLPVDLIVVTPKEVEENREKVGSIIRTALLEGQVVYERPK